MTTPTTPIIEHDAATQCFSLHVEGQRCVLDYTLVGQTMTITHTGVPDALGGRGLAGQLTKFALEHARAHDWKVVPRCSYAAVYIRRHTEYERLLA
jgi:predicted GNAT family acetyltransferase